MTAWSTSAPQKNGARRGLEEMTARMNDGRSRANGPYRALIELDAPTANSRALPPGGSRRRRLGSAADAVSCKYVPITLDVFALQVVEQATPLTNELEQTTTRVMILRVDLEVLGQVVDSLRHETDLHLGGAGIRRVDSGLFDDALLCAGEKRHFFLGCTR